MRWCGNKPGRVENGEGCLAKATKVTMMSPRAAAFTKAFTGILCTGLTYHLVFINEYNQHEGTNVFTPVSLSIARCVPSQQTCRSHHDSMTPSLLFLHVLNAF